MPLSYQIEISKHKSLLSAHRSIALRCGMAFSKKVVTFGEIMLRLAPPGYERLVSTRRFDATFGGGEANVAISLANFHVPVDFVTRLPSNDLGDACLNYLRQFGVGVSKIVRGGERIGIYFLETGADQRGGKVVYDRSGSSAATIEPGMIDWKDALADARWLHVTGITPAVSGSCADSTIEAVSTAHSMHVIVSVDLNYRAKLWKWGKPTRDVMTEILRSADVVIGNEEDAEKVFGIKASGVDVVSGRVDEQKYKSVAEELRKQFPNVGTVAITVRGSINADHNTWSGCLMDGTGFFTAPVHDITDIVDRVGAGDAFAGGLIYGLMNFKGDAQKALNFATAAGCLKHSIPGDANLVTVEEVEALMSGIGSGRVSR